MICDCAAARVIFYLKLQLSGAMRIFDEHILNNSLRKENSFKSKLNAASIGLAMTEYVVTYCFHSWDIVKFQRRSSQWLLREKEKCMLRKNPTIQTIRMGS